MNVGDGRASLLGGDRDFDQVIRILSTYLSFSSLFFEVLVHVYIARTSGLTLQMRRITGSFTSLLTNPNLWEEVRGGLRVGSARDLGVVF